MATWSKTTTEIEQSLIDGVKEVVPNITLTPGTPAYDLMIFRLARVIKEERDLVEILSNIARVAPMFGTDGYLLPEYQEYTPHLIERFFIEADPLTEAFSTVYLRFNKRGPVTIKPGSTIFYDNIELPVTPTTIYENSNLWQQGPEGYYHPITVGTLNNVEDATIPSTEAWTTGLVNFASKDPQMLLTGARSKRSINIIRRPELSLTAIRNSISNRSMSNIRALEFNLATNSGFSPDDMLKHFILTSSDTLFIERRKVLYQNDHHMFSALVGGKGKALLDYGVQLNVAPVTLEYIPMEDPYYFEAANPTIINNPRNILRNIIVAGMTEDNTDRGALFATMSRELNEEGYYDITITFYSDSTLINDVAQAELPSSEADAEAYLSDRLIITPLNESGLSGWVDLVVDPEYFTVDTTPGVFKIHQETFSLYRIKTDSLGLFAPIALMGDAACQELRDRLISTDLEDIVPPFTRAATAVPGTSVMVIGDPTNQIHEITFAPIGEEAYSLVWGSFMSGEMYWRITEDAETNKYFLISTTPYFDNPAKLVSRTLIPDSYSAGEHLSLTVPGSGYLRASISFNADYGDIEEDIRAGNRLLPSSNFIRVSNEEVILRANPGASVTANSADGRILSLLYLGTDREKLIQSQELFMHYKRREVASEIMVTPFRPVTFTCYYSPQYISPFLKDKDYTGQPNGDLLNERLENYKAQYVELLNYLEEFMNNYTGLVSDINLSELSSAAYEATGLQIKRLDYSLYTQRGYRISGRISLDFDRDIHLDWDEVISLVEQQADNRYHTIMASTKRYLHEEEREALVTDQRLYRPMFSKIGV